MHIGSDFFRGPVNALSMLHHRVLIFPLAFAIAMSAGATIYYVSPTGNDSNNGTSQSTPWQTINRVNTSTFSMLPGDQVLFQRGGTYRGRLQAGSSGNTTQPVTFGAYGTGAAPIISGSQLVTGWSVHSGSIYKATVSSPVKYLYIGGVRQNVARYPNSGWLFNDLATVNTLQDGALTQGAGYFTGAQAVVRNANWSYEVLTITNFTGTTLSFTPNIQSLGTGAWGYFLQNKLNLLDQAGEWFYDATTSQLYLWAPGGVNPATLTVEVAVTNYGFEMLPNRHHVTVDGLAFQHQILNSFEGSVSDHIIVRNCTFSETYRAFATNCSYNTYEFNTISNTYGTSMVLVDQYAMVKDNVFTNIGMVPGLGESWWGYMGMRVLGPGCIVRNNRLDNIGYIAISFQNSVTVEKNYITNATAMLNDGGGISFDNCDGAIVRDNTVVNTQGSLTTSAANMVDTYHLMGHGIYFGNTSIKNTLVQNNTVVNSSGAGIHVDHTMVSTGNQVKDNVLFNNKIQLTLSDFSNSVGTGATAPYYMATYNNVVSGNILHCLTKDQLCMKLINVWGATPTDFGTFSNNKYYNPYNELSIFYYNQFAGVLEYYNLERWQAERGEDLTGSSRFTEQQRDAYAVTSVLSSNLVVNGTFNTSVTGWTGWPTNAQVSLVGGQLDGNCLYANLPNNSVYNTFTMRNPDAFAIQSGQWYRMKFSLKSDVHGVLDIGVKPNSQILTLLMAGQRTYPFGPLRREVEYIFQDNGYTENAYVQFRNDYTDPRYWLDNVVVERVAVSPVDPATENVVFYNTAASPQSFTLPAGCWQEVGGALTSGSITVDAYRARTFYKSTATTCSGGGGTANNAGVKVFLAGALNWGTGIMRDDLRAAGLIPNAEPYSALGLTLQNAGATISTAVSSMTGNSAMVDWVVVELRNSDAGYSVAERRAAIVLRDGTVVAPDGSTLITFTTTTAGKYVAVRHRNHLGCMSASPLAANGATVDFTSLGTALYGTGATTNDATRRALWPGNSMFDGAVKYTGTSNDRDPILSAIGGVVPTNSAGGYLGTDVNMDAWTVYTGAGNDRDFLLTTIGGVVPTATRVEQLP